MYKCIIVNSNKLSNWFLMEYILICDKQSQCNEVLATKSLHQNYFNKVSVTKSWLLDHCSKVVAMKTFNKVIALKPWKKFIQQSKCSEITPTTSLQRSHCNEDIATKQLQQSHCKHDSINVIATKPLQQNDCCKIIAAKSLQQSHWNELFATRLL